jgi:copper chaperone CopZ
VTISGQDATRIVRLRIEGMGCDGCVVAVRQALQAVPGVVRALVELKEAAAEVEVAPATEPQDLLQAVDRAGYHATLA